MAAYLTYSDYVAMGGVIDETTFSRIAFKASALITRLTHGRIANENPVRDSARYCAYEIVNAMSADEESGADGRVIASMSNDGMSVTYAGAIGDAAQVNAARYANIVRSYLEYESDSTGTSLLYAGF